MLDVCNDHYFSHISYVVVVFFSGEIFHAIEKFGKIFEGRNEYVKNCFLFCRLIFFFRMRRTALAWMSRVRLLEGAGDLEKLNQSEIKEIIGVLEVGLQRAKNSLNVLERDEQNNLANSNAANVRPNAVSNYASNTNLFPSNLSKKSL